MSGSCSMHGRVGKFIQSFVWKSRREETMRKT